MNNNNIILTNIINLFEHVKQMTKIHVNRIELKPIKIKGNTYLCGIKRHDINKIELHIKKLNIVTIVNNEELFNNEPLEEFYLDYELITQDVLQTIFSKFKQYFNQNYNKFIITQITYNENNNYANIEENTVYDDKKLACKEIIKLRKIKNNLKSSFKYINQINDDNTTNDEDFANQPL